MKQRLVLVSFARHERPLSLSMIRRLNQTLNISAEVLIRPVRIRKRTA